MFSLISTNRLRFNSQTKLEERIHGAEVNLCCFSPVVVVVVVVLLGADKPNLLGILRHVDNQTTTTTTTGKVELENAI